MTSGGPPSPAADRLIIRVPPVPVFAAPLAPRLVSRRGTSTLLGPPACCWEPAGSGNQDGALAGGFRCRPRLFHVGERDRARPDLDCPRADLRHKRRQLG